jgi:ferric-dicitrate binding protein FerR (iron transport regulator)
MLADGLLAQAEELLQRDQELAVEEPELAKLVQRSRRQKRARERRRRILLGGALIVALVLAVVAWFAWVQRNEAITAKDVAQKRLEAVHISLQAVLSKYIDYLDKIGFPADTVFRS